MINPPTTKQGCQALNAAGKPCRAGAQTDKQYCYMHDPELQHQATAARVAGGKARNKPAPAPPIDLSTPELQRRAIEHTIDRVRAGDESISIGRFVIYAIGTLRGLFDEEAMKRLEALEAAAQERKHG